MNVSHLVLALAGGQLAVSCLETPLRRLLGLAAALLDAPLGEADAAVGWARARLAQLRQTPVPLASARGPCSAPCF